jgi:hypothetical protein
VAAQHGVESAEAAADPGPRRVEKALAREAYQRALEVATTDGARQDAAAAWATAIDRLNRQGRLAARAQSRARARLAAAQEALTATERLEQTARFRAEAAQAACLEGRVRLAACEERVSDVPVGATSSGPDSPATGHAARIGEVPGPRPLVIEAMVAGDADALERAVVTIAERAVLSPAEVRLQLRELIDGVVAAAADAGYLVFDASYPLWAELTYEESRDVVVALARLGFQPEPRAGWRSGRQPAGTDLAMALGYAGMDVRYVRTLPGSVELAAMPASIGVDARAFLAAHAADLGVDQLVRLLGPRAAAMESLWDAWGQVRPVLFSERKASEVGETVPTG